VTPPPGQIREVGMRSETMEHIVLLFDVVSIMIPLGQLLRRIGFSRWWILLSFVPIINIVGLWIIAYANWPRDNQTSD
jgi:formate/nitrite transporter FocA (FNT family)